jgi:hypothetical protein
MSAVAKLPQGWSVELLGIINGVKFENTGGSGLLWCDGQWTITAGQHSRRAIGLADARTQADARRIGTAFIRNLV